MKNNSKIKSLRIMDVTDLSGEKVMIDMETGSTFLIKGIGNDIWDMLEDGIQVQDIKKHLLAEYDVAEDVCEREVLKFLNQLESMHILGEM